MSINAGVIFLPLSGMEAYEDPLWKNIRLEVHYPQGQNFSNNPIQPNDYAIDQLGRVWRIDDVVDSDSSNNVFTCNIEYAEGTPSQSIQPDLGGTNYGLVITPQLGGLDPYWDASYVSDPVYRKAVSYGVRDITSDAIRGSGSGTVAEIARSYNAQPFDSLYVNTNLNEFQSNHNYSKGDMIRRNGKIYRAKKSFQSGSSFNPDNWMITNVIKQFDSNSSYKTGEIVKYNNQFYQATTDVSSGPFNSSNWKQVPQWESQKSYINNDVVSYKNAVYFCTSGFTSGSSFNPTNWEKIPDWQPNTSYHQGDQVAYSGYLYECNAGYVSPDEFSTSFWVNVSYWQPGTSYINGDRVAFDGKIYECTAGFVSESTFNDSNWSIIPSWQSGTAYSLGDHVTYNGNLYVANSSFTSGSDFASGNWNQITNYSTWEPSTDYYDGDYVIHNGNFYACNAGFVSGGSFDSANWSQVATIGTWQADTAYSAGTYVEYDGNVYKCVDSFNGESTFGSLVWEKVSQWQSNRSYTSGDYVKYDGKLYQADSDHTSGSSFEIANWTEVTNIPNWQPNTSYKMDEVVQYDGEFYINKVGFVTSDTFNASNWTELIDVITWEPNQDYYYYNDSNFGQLVAHNGSVYKCTAGFVTGDTFNLNNWNLFDPFGVMLPTNADIGDKVDVVNINNMDFPIEVTVADPVTDVREFVNRYNHLFTFRKVDDQVGWTVDMAADDIDVDVENLPNNIPTDKITGTFTESNIPDLSASKVIESSSRKFVSDEQITSWNQASASLVRNRVSSSHSAAPNEIVIADTSSGSFTVTLPGTGLETGTRIGVIDAVNTFGSNNLLVGRNGNLLNGLAEDLNLNVSGVYVLFIYDENYGWHYYINNTNDLAYIEEKAFYSYNWKTISSNHNALPFDGLVADSQAASFNIDLPGSPNAGDQIMIVDPKGTWAANNVTVVRNGNPINGTSEDLLLDQNFESVHLVYSNSEIGWVINRSLELSYIPMPQWTIIESNYTAQSEDNLIIGDGITITLPASPSVGNYVRVACGGDWETTSSTIAPNGDPIEGTVENLILNTNQEFTLYYKGSDRGWIVMEGVFYGGGGSNSISLGDYVTDADLTTHTDDANAHHTRFTSSEARTAVGGSINDSGSSTSDIWSADKINSELSQFGTSATRDVTISTSQPTSSDGNDGDIWYVVSS